MKNSTKVLSALLATLLAAAVQAAEPVVLKVHHFLPPQAPQQSKFIDPWCAKIASESKGGLKCEVYPSMQLGGRPPQLLSQVVDGVADIVLTLPGYTPGRFPVSEVFELPFMMTTNEATSRALWDFIAKNGKEEFKGVVPIATWVNGPNVLHLRNKQVKTLADLKGLKVRAPSRQGTALLSALGATPIGMPVPQMAESLSKGVIDGALVPWEVVPATKTHELVKFHAEAGGKNALTTATMVLLMNQAKYDALPANLKKVIDENRGRDTSAWVSSEFDKAGAAGVAAATGRGNAIYKIPETEMVKWQKAAKSVDDAWVKEVNGLGKDGKALLQEAKSLIAKYTK